jgi:hypothetical protein
MSARAAVFSLLANDPDLNMVGISAENIWPAQSIDTAPRTGGVFLILRWEEQTIVYAQTGSEVLTVWAHCPRESSTDYVPLLMVLERVTKVLTEATHVVGEDGVLTCVEYNGLSADLDDEGYHTITKNAAYTVVSR